MKKDKRISKLHTKIRRLKRDILFQNNLLRLQEDRIQELEESRRYLWSCLRRSI